MSWRDNGRDDRNRGRDGYGSRPPPAPAAGGGGGGSGIGRGEQLTTNMFVLKPCDVGNGIYKHVVMFDPPECPPRVKAAALHNYDKIGGKDFILRGDSLIMRERLEDSVFDFTTKTGKHSMRVTIKAGTRVVFDGEREATAVNEALSLNSICLKRMLKTFPGVTEMGRSFVDLHRGNRNVRGFEMCPGFGISAALRASGSLAEIDLSTRILSDGTLLDKLRDGRARDDDFVGTGVLTTYNNMLYRFKAFDHSLTPMSTFTKRKRGEDGSVMEEEVSYAEYTKRTYGLHCEIDPRQPMVTATFRGDRKQDGTREEKEVKLIPQLCRVVGYTKAEEGDTRLRREVSRATKLDSQQRQQKLMEVVRKFNEVCPATCAKGHLMALLGRTQTPAKCSACGHGTPEYTCPKCKGAGYFLCRECATRKVRETGFKVELEARQVSVQSKVITGAALTTAADKGAGVAVGGAETGSWDRFHGFRLSAPLDLNNWVLLYEDRAAKTIGSFIDSLRRVGGQMDIIFREPAFKAQVRGRDAGSYEYALQQLPDWPQIVVVLLAGQDKASYDTAKQVFTRYEVLSQVVTQRTAGGGLSFVTKIAIQIAAKLGHAPWRVTFNAFPGQTGAGAMFVGMDSAPGPMGKRLVAMVSTVDGTRCERYWNQTHFFREAEAGAIVKEMMKEALEAHKASAGSYPSHVIVYRNGVSDAEIRGIEAPRVGEYAQIAAALEDLHIAPCLDFILVIRTGSLRLFSASRNPMPGTVVDTGITVHARDPTLGAPRSDFYMVSQKAQEGCVRPAHYRIIANSSFLSKENLEEITHKLAHLYYNWTGTIAVPAPVLLAQKLTRMIVEHKLDVTPTGLKEFTYYI